MRILRQVLRGVIATGLVLVAAPCLAQCVTSATITVDGTATETLGPASCVGGLNLFHVLGPIRIANYSWNSQVDASGGFRFDIHAQFLNDVDTVNHNISITQNITGMPTGTRRWYSSYSGMAFETPGPGGNASDGILFVTPNHMDSAVSGTPVGNFDYPINDNPAPLSDPFGCMEMTFCQAGPILINGNGTGVIHLNMTLGRGDVNDLKHTASIYSPSNAAVPVMSTWGLAALLLAIGTGGFYLISRWPVATS